MTEETNASLEESVNLAEKMMGAFSARILHLENLMCNIMDQHFRLDNAERAVIFLSAMTPDMSFRNKINIFINMIKIYYDEIYKTHDSDLRKLYEIDKYWNDLATLMIAQSGQASKNTQTISLEATGKEHESKVRLCIRIAAILNAIQREILINKLS